MAALPNTIMLPHEYSVLNPQRTIAYPVPQDEWYYLKDKICKLKNLKNRYHSVAIFLLGIAVSAIYTLVKDWPDLNDLEVLKSYMFYICTIIVCAFGAVTCWNFSRKTDKLQKASSDEILGLMELIEKRYKVKDYVKEDTGKKKGMTFKDLFKK